MIKLSEIFTNYGDYQAKVINVIKLNYDGAEWLDDALNYTKQESLYNLLMLKYGDRYIRYDNVDIFINKLIFDLTDILPDIFAKQQVFIKNKLAEFLSDEKNRAVIIDSKSANTRDSNSNSKVGNSASPLNLVINNADEILNAPITSSNLSNIKLLENYDGKSNQVNYNFVNDLVKTLNADYSLRLSEFMSFLSKHFVSVVGNYYRHNCCNDTIKGDGATFNNGYKVNEVNYYGEENKQAIQVLSGKVEENKTSIQVVNSNLVDLRDEVNKLDVSGINNEIEKINQEQQKQNAEIESLRDEIGGLGDLTNIENKINQNTSDIKSINLKITSIENKQIGYDSSIERLNNQVETNKQDITTLRNDLGDLGNVVNQNTSEINKIKTQQIQQDNDIADNSQAIEANTQKINDYKTSNDLEISKLKEKDTQLENNFANYQVKLIAGEGINISGSTISATNSGVPSDYQQVKDQVEFNKNEIIMLDQNVKLNTRKINGKCDILNLETGVEFSTGDIVNTKMIYMKYVSGKLENTQYVNLVNNAIVFDYNIMCCDIENGTYFSIDSKEWNSRSEIINLYNNSNNSIGINFIRDGFYRGWVKYYKV